MNYVSIGDMARMFQLRSHQTQLKSTLMQLSSEMSSGLKSDPGAAVRGDFTALAGIERTLATLSAYRTATAEASQTTAVMQTALEAVQRSMTDLSPTLFAAAAGSNPTAVDAGVQHGRQVFGAVVSALNTSVTGRYVFSGAATDIPPLAPADDILAALQAEIAGETSAAAIETAVDAWFAAPAGGGGYLDIAYQGSDAPLAPFRIGEGEIATLTLTAADAQIRDVLKGLALASLLAEGALSDDMPERLALTRMAAEKVLAADSGLALIRSAVGTAEGMIGGAEVRNAAETSAMKIARATLREADPYETATALEALQTQLETLYLLTERLSRMRFSDYMR